MYRIQAILMMHLLTREETQPSRQGGGRRRSSVGMRSLHKLLPIEGLRSVVLLSGLGARRIDCDKEPVKV